MKVELVLFCLFVFFGFKIEFDLKWEVNIYYYRFSNYKIRDFLIIN